MNNLFEVFVRPVATRKTDESEARWQEASVCEVVNSRHELFAGEVSGYPEDDEAARPRNSIQTTVFDNPKGVIEHGFVF
jgi:hypothetical protein